MINTLKDFISETVAIFKSDHPFMMLLTDITSFISSIWNFSLYTTTDKQDVFVGNVIIAILLFILGLKIARSLSKHVKNKLPPTLDLNTVTTLERLSYYFFLIVITVFVLEVTNVPLTIFTIVGTTLALGIGLGSQNMVNNFISGLIILIERPIKLGDIIEVRNFIGTVTNIGARCVSIRTPENIIMLIPNSNILQDIVINWTHEDSRLKSGLLFTIKKAPNVVTKFEKIVIEALLKNKATINDPAPKIILKGIHLESYVIEVEFWLDLESSEGTKYIIDELNRSFDVEFEAEGIQVIEQYEEKHLPLAKE